MSSFTLEIVLIYMINYKVMIYTNNTMNSIRLQERREGWTEGIRDDFEGAAMKKTGFQQGREGRERILTGVW